MCWSPTVGSVREAANFPETCADDGSVPPSGQAFISIVPAAGSTDNLTVYQPGTSVASVEVF